MGDVIQGLYHLQQADVSPSILTEKFSFLNKPVYILAAITQALENFHLWHYRLGHPSHSRLQFINDPVVIKSSSHINGTICTICPLSKLH